MTDAILVLNAGSSSLKFALYDVGAGDLLARGLVDHRDGKARLSLKANAVGLKLDGAETEMVALLLDAIEGAGLSLAAVGHRIVHGGQNHSAPVRINDEVLQALTALTPLAPLHQPHNLAPIAVIAERFADLIQIACFDTAFHAGQDALERRYALPRTLSDEGIIRYGFHGLSYDYIASILPDHLGERAQGRVIVAHLGHGASLCAMKNRRSVATTMGFTALDGLMMGTRSGSIDPGIILYLMQHKGYSAETISDLLYRRSGLLGVSGLSSDMRSLIADGSVEAMEAVDMFAYRIVREIGSLTAALGGLDGLVFTGGIGEHSTPVRARILRQCEWLGLSWESALNEQDATRLSTADSAVTALVLPTDEEGVIFRQTKALL